MSSMPILNGYTLYDLIWLLYITLLYWFHVQIHLLIPGNKECAKPLELLDYNSLLITYSVSSCLYFLNGYSLELFLLELQSLCKCSTYSLRIFLACIRHFFLHISYPFWSLIHWRISPSLPTYPPRNCIAWTNLILRSPKYFFCTHLHNLLSSPHYICMVLENMPTLK